MENKVEDNSKEAIVTLEQLADEASDMARTAAVYARWCADNQYAELKRYFSFRHKACCDVREIFNENKTAAGCFLEVDEELQVLLGRKVVYRQNQLETICEMLAVRFEVFQHFAWHLRKLI